MRHFLASKLLSDFFRVSVFVFCLSIFIYGYAPTPAAQGASVAELQAQIQDRNEQLAQLEAEIAKYEEELTKIGADRQTLEAEIARLDTSRKKLATDIAVTENRIATTDLQLEELGDQITDKERRIDESKGAIQSGLRSLAKLDTGTFAETLLASAKLSDVWEDGDQLRRVQTALSNEVTLLAATKNALIDDYTEAAQKQGQLVSYKKELSGQKRVLDSNRQEQSSILSTTKNTESAYQKLLDDKREAQKQLEAEIKSFEAEIQYTLDPTKIPAAGSGVLKFPFDPSVAQRCLEREKVFGNLYCITQYFGNTAFAQSGAYNGKGHNGIDFGISEGTKIVTALSGIVEAWGNTDAVPGCYSYGKWVLVKHPNGLSSLYAHLSVISVEKGEPVATGQLLGYSGKTGYATGPHLHFTVFASDGVQIKNLRDWYASNGASTGTPCAKGGAIIPVAGTEAYLNPLDYL